MHKIFQIPLSFYCPLPLPSHEEAVSKKPNALCRDRWEHDYTGNFCTSCGEWHLFLSAHMDRAHDIVIFSNPSLIIKALFANPEIIYTVYDVYAKYTFNNPKGSFG